MAKYKKILVAYDGSESAKHALRMAGRLGRLDKSWIKVLAVIPAYQGDLELVGVSNIKETMAGPGQKLLAEAKRLADEEDVHVLCNLEQGEPFTKIVQVAEEENCDLIIMGRKGVSHLEREMIGGVSARVIGHTDKDVLITPNEATLDWDHLLLATDGSKFSEAAVSRAFDIALYRQAKLTVVCAVDTNEEFFSQALHVKEALIEQARTVVEKVAAAGREKGLEIETIVRDGEPHRIITDTARSVSASLIVMGSHGRKGLTRLLMGSVTERVIGYTHCPVLVSHA